MNRRRLLELLLAALGGAGVSSAAIGLASSRPGAEKTGASYIVGREDGRYVAYPMEPGLKKHKDTDLYTVLQNAVDSLGDREAVIVLEAGLNLEGMWVRLPPNIYLRGPGAHLLMGEYFDDFLGLDKNVWSIGTSGTGSVDIQQDGKGGILTLLTGDSPGSSAGVFLGGLTRRAFSASQGLRLEFRARLPGAVTDLRTFCGLSTLDGRNHIGWTARTADNIWRFRCESMVEGPIHDKQSDVDVDNEWHVFRIDATPSDARFYLDGSLKASLKPVPQTPLSLEFIVENTTNASRELLLDWVKVKYGRG